MTRDHHTCCERCGHESADGARAFLSYGPEAARQSVCENCLSWTEKDLFRSLGPRRRVAAEREGRFSRGRREPARGPRRPTVSA